MVMSRPTSQPGPRRRLTSEDWVTAALAAIADGGVAAVAVEPLAARLGATKGSFYWHFPHRRALLDAALARWEAERTEAVIAATERIEDPLARLEELITMVLTDLADPFEVRLHESARDPAVGPVVARITQRRIDYVAGLYRAAGQDERTAYSSAVAAVSVYLGHVQLAQSAPGSLPSGAGWEAHRARVRSLLAPRRGSSRPAD
jgi:AcrR family transcriptional regulator